MYIATNPSVSATAASNSVGEMRVETIRRRGRGSTLWAFRCRIHRTSAAPARTTIVANKPARSAIVVCIAFARFHRLRRQIALLRRLYLSFAVIHLLLSANPKGQHGKSRLEIGAIRASISSSESAAADLSLREKRQIKPSCGRSKPIVCADSIATPTPRALLKDVFLGPFPYP